MRRVFDISRIRTKFRALTIALAGTAVVLGGAGLARATGNTDAEKSKGAVVEASAPAAEMVVVDEATTAAEAPATSANSADLRATTPTSADHLTSVDTTSTQGKAAEESAPTREVLDTFTGSASYYANSLAGRRTASGVPYRPDEMIAAHKTLPFGTLLRVTNLANDRTVEVRVVDRGPYAKGRILDLSRRAVEELDFIRRGHTRVKVEVLEYGKGPR